jgi:hypothetical protein
MQLETVFSREMDPTAQQQQAQELLQMFQFGVSPQHQICVPTSYNNIRDKKL